LANHYHKSATSGDRRDQPDGMLAEIRLFLDRCARPAALEWGDEAVPLVPDQYLLEIRNGHLFLSAWPDRRSISRKLIGIETRKPGLLVCSIQKFGGVKGRLNLLDLDHPRTGTSLLQGERRSFLEGFRRMLHRQFTGWTIEMLTTEMSLERSFSPRYPRAVLRKANQRMAALACPRAEDEHAFLSFALLWHHYVCGTSGLHARVPLVLFLPEGAGSLTALRLKWLSVTARLFRFNRDGNAGEIDPADLGNLETRVLPRKRLPIPPELEPFVTTLQRKFNAEVIDDGAGASRLRIEGLEFAIIRNGRLYSSLNGEPQETSTEEIETIASHIALVRNGTSGDRQHPFFCMCPENWLEAAVRRDLGVLDATLEGQPLLGQVITFAAVDRDIIDLVGTSKTGRLALIELKIAEDIHLPLQALDYWMRIDWHTQAGEMDQFFPGITVRPEPPKLMLVAPAVQFHPANETILGYFDARIETERIGLNLEWQQGLKVAFRLYGSEKPQSHRRPI
jgi:hypothetical protein